MRPPLAYAAFTRDKSDATIRYARSLRYADHDIAADALMLRQTRRVTRCDAAYADR